MAKKSVSAFDLAKRGQDEKAATPSTVQSGLGNLDAGAMRRALVSEGQMVIGPFTLTPISLEISRQVNEQEWTELGKILLRLDTSLQWLVGDWLVYAEREWGKTYQQVAEQFDYRVETLWSYASVCRAVDSLIRNQGLSFSHHRLVAGLPIDDQRQWLEYAAINSLSLSQMRTAMAGDSPALSSNLAYDRLFSRDNKPNISRFEKLYVKAGQGDRRASDNLLSQIEQHRRWLDEIERLVRGQS